MSSAPRPCTAAGNRGKPRSGCHQSAEPAVGRGDGAAERSSLRPSCAPLLPRAPRGPHLCLSSQARLHPAVWPLLLLARALAQPSSQAPEAKVQPDSHGPGLGRQPGPGRGRPARGGCGAGWSPSSQPKSPASPGVALSWRAAFPPCSSSPRQSRTTHRPSPQLPPRTPHHKSEPLLLTQGHCTGHPRGTEGQASGHSGLGGLCAVLLKNAHPLWSRQAALHQGGRKPSETETAPLPAPTWPPKAQAEQSCLYLPPPGSLLADVSETLFTC